MNVMHAFMTSLLTTRTIHMDRFSLIALQEVSYNFRRSRVPRTGPTYRYSMGLSDAFKGDLIDHDTVEQITREAHN